MDALPGTRKQRTDAFKSRASLATGHGNIQLSPPHYIYMNEMELLVQLHRNNLRQGPGSEETTLLAAHLGHINKEKEYRIADLGCGTGAQTIHLAKMLKGEIVAVDLFPTFLNKLKENYDHEVKQGNVTASLRTIAASMDSLPFDKEEFDIIWSEGAIYNIGFERGVNYWKPFLKKEGILAVSELSWTTRKRPSEVELFWNSEYPEMNTIAGKTAILEDAGYKVLGHFILPDNCWTDNYYLPLLKRHNEFLQAYGENELARQIVEKDRQEFELYKKYREFYNYGFYIAQKA